MNVNRYTLQKYEYIISINVYLGCCAIFLIYFIDKHIISPIIKYNIIQRAKSEIDNTLLKDEDFHKYLL